VPRRLSLPVGQRRITRDVEVTPHARRATGPRPERFSINTAAASPGPSSSVFTPMVRPLRKIWASPAARRFFTQSTTPKGEPRLHPSRYGRQAQSPSQGPTIPRARAGEALCADKRIGEPDLRRSQRRAAENGGRLPRVGLRSCRRGRQSLEEAGHLGSRLLTTFRLRSVSWVSGGVENGGIGFVVGDGQTCFPTWGAPLSWGGDVFHGHTATNKQPRNHRIGIPHLAGP